MSFKITHGTRTTVRSPHADDDPRVSVSMKGRGCKLVLFFDDLSGDGPVRELRVLPESDEVAELAPEILAQVAPQSPLYVTYARAVLRFDRDDMRSAVMALRDLGSTRRGLTDEFFSLIAHNYEAIVSEGEPHPVKALAAMHHVTISAASRWIKEARQRGLIEETKEKT